MFDDYNGYFKGNRVGAPNFGAFPIAGRSNPHAPSRDLSRGAPHAVRAFRRTENVRTKKTTLRPIVRNRLFCRLKVRGTARATRYILSIMALPKPEHETCVEPGMSRAKS